MPTHKFLITVKVNDDHNDATDSEWWADAATGALGEYDGVATFELLPTVSATRALAAYDEIMDDSEEAEEIDTGDAINVMTDLAAALEAIVSVDDRPPQAPHVWYRVLRNGSIYGSFGTPESAEQFRNEKEAEQAGWNPPPTWTVVRDAND
jgi:hypothetical protein